MARKSERSNHSERIRRYAVFTHARVPSPLLCPEVGKTSFASAAAALRFRDEERRAGRIDGLLDAYRCPYCPYFHLTTARTTSHLSDTEAALKDLSRAARRVRVLVGADGESPEHVGEVVDSLLAVDRRLRLVATPPAAGADDLRRGLATFLLSCGTGDGDGVARALGEIIPLALETETWGWVVVARRKFLDAVDMATLEDSTAALAGAVEGYLSSLDTHIATHGLDPASVFSSEFALVCEETADSIEFSVFERSATIATEALYRVEERSFGQVSAA